MSFGLRWRILCLWGNFVFDLRHRPAQALQRLVGQVAVLFLIFFILPYSYCYFTDEMRGFEETGHPLRAKIRQVLVSCIGNEGSVNKAFNDGLSAGQIERQMTPWWDDAYLVEWLFQPFVETYGHAQVHWRTALTVYQRYAANGQLNRFLDLDRDQIKQLRVGSATKYQVVS